MHAIWRSYNKNQLIFALLVITIASLLLLAMRAGADGGQDEHASAIKLMMNIRAGFYAELIDCFLLILVCRL